MSMIARACPNSNSSETNLEVQTQNLKSIHSHNSMSYGTLTRENDMVLFKDLRRKKKKEENLASTTGAILHLLATLAPRCNKRRICKIPLNSL